MYTCTLESYFFLNLRNGNIFIHDVDTVRVYMYMYVNIHVHVGAEMEKAYMYTYSSYQKNFRIVL